MAMTICKECSKEISTTAKLCPHCGARVPRTRWWLVVLLALFAGAFWLVAIVGNSPEVQVAGEERAKIAYCWEQARRESLTPEEKRLFAATCERMEQE